MQAMYATNPGRARAGVVRALVALLAVAYALRLLLVAGGGQGYWPDESRFVQAVDGARLMAAGDVVGGFRSVAGSADHVGFKVLSLAPAAVQVAAGAGLALSAALLALVSALNVLLVYFVARRAGADDIEALGAALAMACSNAMFYWSRHLMPYDTGLAFGLALLYIALKPQPRVRDSLAAGALGFAAFATYAGYWTFVAVGFAIHAGAALPGLRAAASRCVALLAGFAGCVAIAAVATVTLLDVDLIASWRGFAGTVTQGDFDDGHGVTFGYLWHAERAMVVVWLLAAGALPLAAIAGRRVEPRGWLWLACAAGVLAVLVAGSNVLGKFVVYGRLVRQAVPFLALLAGYVLFGPWRLAAPGRRQGPMAAIVLVAIAAVNFARPLRQEFPEEFVARGREVIATRADPTARYRFVNAQPMWPLPTPVTLPPDARVLLQARHPLQFRPYLYEGFDRRQRAAFRAADLAMRLVVE